jgi:hypothetical protein
MEPQEELPQARVSIPVHSPEVITLDVGAKIGELR